MITAIKIDEENFKNYSLVKSEKEKNQGYLDNLSKINIFIGENNSGKSRFMREVFSNVAIKYQNKISKNIQISLINLVDNINYIMPPYKLDAEIIEQLKQKIFSHAYMTNGHFSKNSEILDEITSPFYNKIPLYGNNQDYRKREIKQKIDDLREQTKENTDNLTKENKNLLEAVNKSIYIPMLRGLRTYESLPKYNTNHDTSFEIDVYKWRTEKDYFKESGKKLNDRIFTGLNLYEKCKNLLLGAKEDRDKIRNFEEFLSECFFDGKDFNLIPSITDDVLHVLIGNQERPIYELGDGIQSVIILTYPLFFNQGEHMLFFFEEPEQCLHPAYQRVFMETLMREEFNTFQYFFTTHSNHLLDITLDIDKVSIYTFKKTNDSMDNPTFEIENVDNENTDILRLIGVRNSSVFLLNCTIWVEGITDRIYIRKYLEVYQEEEIKKAKEEKREITHYLEDIHYSFVEYGGNNITHWSFLEDADPNHKNILVDRLCGKLFLITDQDGAGKKKDGTVDNSSSEKKAKYARHIKLKEKLGDKHYHCLETREIENLLSTDVLKNVVLSYEKDDNAEFEFKEKFDYENYKYEKIGEFIEKNIIGWKRIGGYAADSGTIKGSKFEFSKRAVENIEKISDLSEEARDLTEKLYEFIKEQNKK